MKNLPTVWTHVQSLGQEDSLEKGKATHSSILAWRIRWPEDPGRLSSWGHKQSICAKIYVKAKFMAMLMERTTGVGREIFIQPFHRIN